MIRVAMLSKWHVHANDYAKQLRNQKNVEIVAVWDEELERGSTWAKELGVDFESDLNTLLSRNDIDAVAVDAPTNMHTEVIVAAAKAGKHIFTEKVLALTIKECKEIEKAVNEAGVKFCISFPHRTNPNNLFAKKVVVEGLLGDITLMRVRNAHNGSIANWLPAHFYNEEQCGGGAMMDLGAHPMYLARWILGTPKKVSSIFNNFTNRAVEDNAVSILEFENKALAIVETGFVSAASPFSLELYGTHGSLLIGGPKNEVKINSSKITSDVAGWISPSQLPQALPTAIEQWVRAIEENTPIEFGVQEGIELTELMEAAYLSFKEKRVVEFSELI